jgi:hypothetical protein
MLRVVSVARATANVLPRLRLQPGAGFLHFDGHDKPSNQGFREKSCPQGRDTS